MHIFLALNSASAGYLTTQPPVTSQYKLGSPIKSSFVSLLARAGSSAGMTIFRNNSRTAGNSDSGMNGMPGRSLRL